MTKVGESIGTVNRAPCVPLGNERVLGVPNTMVWRSTAAECSKGNSPVKIVVCYLSRMPIAYARGPH